MGRKVTRKTLPTPVYPCAHRSGGVGHPYHALSRDQLMLGVVIIDVPMSPAILLLIFIFDHEAK